MARLTYGFLAAAAAALIAGFFVKGSSLPLLISISLSVAVSALILYGWSRVVRDEDIDADEEIEEIEVDEPEEMPDRPARRRTRAVKLDETITIEPPADDSLFAPPPRREATSKAKPKAKRSPAKPKAKAGVAKAKAAPAAKKAPARKPAAKRVAVVPGASKYHRPTCRFARSDNVRMVPERVAKDRGYAACDVCKP